MGVKKMWGGRFSAEEDPYFALFNRSLGFDCRLLEADIEGSIAYSVALERAAVLSPSERRKIDRALREIRAAFAGAKGRIAASGAEDVHSFVEQELEKRVGLLSRKLHTGRSRNDQVATDLRLYLRQECMHIEGLLNRLLAAIADRAAEHADAILPGYTHLQRAQPVTFGHFMLAYGEMLLRDRARLREARSRMQVCPLGSGALAGTVYDIDRAKLARDLGFRRPAANSMDAVADRDFVLDFLYFAATTMLHLSRLAEDLILYSSAEFGFVELHDSVSSGSSLMPQKKNPDSLELIRGKSGRVFGHLMGLLTVLKGLPLTYNKDMQEDKECLFDSAGTLSACLEMTSRVLITLRLRTDRMLAATGDGFLNATELADYLVGRGMSFREAHYMVGRMVLRASELELRLEDLPLTVYRSFTPLVDDDIYASLRMETAVSKRRQTGGTAPASVRRAAAAFRRRIRSS